MRDLLNRQGHHIGRRHTRTLMKKMGIQVLYCKPNLSQANQADRKYPYSLKGLAIQRSNEVWLYGYNVYPMGKGFVYLCAVIDWHSRKVLAHRDPLVWRWIFVFRFQMSHDMDHGIEYRPRQSVHDYFIMY